MSTALKPAYWLHLAVFREDEHRRGVGGKFVEMADRFRRADGYVGLEAPAAEFARLINSEEAAALKQWKNYPHYTAQQPDWTQLHRASVKGRAPFPMSVWRGTTHTPGGPLKEGQVVALKGFASTTTDQSSGEAYADALDEPAVYEFQLPKDYPIAFPDVTSDDWPEQEIMLGPSTWQVVKVTKRELEDFATGEPYYEPVYVLAPGGGRRADIKLDPES